MRILSVNAGQDLAGTGIRLKQAFDRYSDSTFNSIARSETYIRYPTDRPWDDARELWDRADVVHLHNNFRTAEILEAGSKPAVIHHHGTFFRENHEALLAETKRRRAVGVAATLDLYLAAPDELEWLPAAYDPDWLASLRTPLDLGRIRIATAPTDRAIKSTDAFISAIIKLKRRYPITLTLIERQSWSRCLARKASADIFFDQVKLGYGCNAIEAMGMGIPVVAGADHATLAEYRRRFGELPFKVATDETIAQSLVELIESPDLRHEIGERGRQHVRMWHSEHAVVSQLEGIYQRALTTS